MPIILATQEAEIRRITVQNQPRQQIVFETHLEKKRAGGTAQGVDPECKPQYHKKKKKEHTQEFPISLYSFFSFRQP
jgi:hypothetical protein